MLGIRRAAITAPMKRMYRFAEMLGYVAYKLSGKYRRIGLKNIMMAYPDMDEQQATKMLRKVFRNFAVSLMDFLMADRFNAEELARMVSLTNSHYLREAHECGHGILLVSAHMGSWELCARALTHLQPIPITVVARDADDPSATTLVNTLRERSGYKVISKGGASALKILRALKRQDAVVLMSDQNSDDLFVPFFGRLAGCVAGPAMLALRSGARIVPLFARRREDGTHDYEFCEPISAHSTGDTDADVLRIITEIHAVIEKQVRMYPDQWLWFHNRWKCRPPGEVQPNA